MLNKKAMAQNFLRWICLFLKCLKKPPLRSKIRYIALSGYAGTSEENDVFTFIYEHFELIDE